MKDKDILCRVGVQVRANGESKSEDFSGSDLEALLENIFAKIPDKFGTITFIVQPVREDATLHGQVNTWTWEEMQRKSSKIQETLKETPDNIASAIREAIYELIGEFPKISINMGFIEVTPRTCLRQSLKNLMEEVMTPKDTPDLDLDDLRDMLCYLSH